MTAEKTNETELLEKKICDYGTTKYHDLVVAMNWARVLKRQEENRGITMALLIEKALLDIVDGRVTHKEVEEATAKLVAAAAERESSPRRREPRVSE